ncbi:MAG: (Fe-S)-binding protein [Bacteroidales bacterium]|jgi:L-lactate dehydrogenase complex protein LldE|nr:(Fe-S)-binding protein [Bacteroidales bacterium]
MTAYDFQTVNLFIPCAMDMFASRIPYTVIALLEKLGFQVIYNPDSTCCGRKFFMSGDMDSAKQLGEKLLKEYDTEYPLIIPSSACAGYIRTHFLKLFEYSTLPASLKGFMQNTYELCDFIVNVAKINHLNNYFQQRVYYFESCAARNMYPLHRAPEQLLIQTRGLELLPHYEDLPCCAANGRFAIQNPEVAQNMLVNIVDKIYNLGAQYITSTDIHCLQYIDSEIHARGGGIEVIHIADILANQE